MKYPVYIFGEMHTKADRDRIEKEVIKLIEQKKVRYLLSEEVGDNVAMTSDAAKLLADGRNYSISNRSYELGIKYGIPVIGIDNWNDKTYSEDKKKSNGEYIDCSRSFKIRETTMANVIEKYGNLGGCVVLIGDSHLRGQPNPVMGDVSVIVKRFLNMPNVTIYRTPDPELKENNVVRIEGKSFNKFAYDGLVKMGDELTKESEQYEDMKFQKRIGEGGEPYNANDFTHPNLETFCFVVDNKIEAMMSINKVTDKLITVGPGYTNKESRGKGMMSKIFEEIFKAYPKNKFGFSLGVLYQNTTALKLYEKLGFKPSHLNMSLAE